MPAQPTLSWSPDDPAFWQARGKLVAHRNLWISVSNLLVAFTVWTLWSVVVVMLLLALALATCGGVRGALLMFVGFYLFCMVLTWWYHVRARSDSAH